MKIRINFMSSEREYDTMLIIYFSFYSIFSQTLQNITQTDVYSIRSSPLICILTNPVTKPMCYLSGDIKNL